MTTTQNIATDVAASKQFQATGAPAGNIVSLTDGTIEEGRRTISAKDLKTLAEGLGQGNTTKPSPNPHARGGMNF